MASVAGPASGGQSGRTSSAVVAAAVAAVGAGGLAAWVASNQEQMGEMEADEAVAVREVRAMVAAAAAEGKKKDKDGGMVHVPTGVQEEVKYRYELRIRQMSAPEKVFEYFASVEDADGSLKMTPVDFMLAITPVATQRPGLPTTLSDDAVKLFADFDVNHDGLISFAEYLFFITLLSIPESEFQVAFKMFDTNHDGTVDADEFSRVMETLKDRTAIGQHSRGGSRSFTHMSDKNEFTETCRGIHAFFGEDGKGSVSFDVFEQFMSRLRATIMHIEFDYYDVNDSGTIPATAFALSVIGYAKTKDISMYLDRIHTLPAHVKNAQFTFKQFQDFNKFLRSIDQVALAITLYGAISGGSIKAEDFAHAAHAVAGVQLDTLQMELMIHLFDHDGDGKLDPEELAAILEKKASRGLNRKRTIGIFDKLACCKSCFVNN
ncbi:Y67H2A.4a [Thecamonas trahens ATCC 50062]|uniref:Y67H2A.4a n=1 Tax=Thecamonas trahens ATCC 50062 TaxID=461836 RepID=A0A0L0D2W3_THETB|nr:Y67H2A.4a [Thecamonas trahens ATCC 50062]KNC46536.1 Y67H2A.4a [Thecamonas trahens ATCC 50062]|eukprot:XP_013760317.1 Y67H2A.4a [Thecamonas trahens ATCC 50062]